MNRHQAIVEAQAVVGRMAGPDIGAMVADFLGVSEHWGEWMVATPEDAQWAADHAEAVELGAEALADRLGCALIETDILLAGRWPDGTRVDPNQLTLEIAA